jgi:hypothetical protein
MDGNRSIGGVVLGTVTLVGVCATGASADALMSFGFTDLSTAFDVNTSILSATSVDNGNLSTGGDVTRLIGGGGGTADFGTGFESLGTLGQFDMSMSISNILVDTADGAGNLLITDANGDTISAGISGEWSLVGGVFYVFQGELDNVFVNDLSGDGQFDGPTGGLFSTSFASPQPYTGAAVYLYFGAPGGFFSKGFDGVSGQIAGEVVPGPGTIALLGLGGVVATGRRRIRG